MHDQHLPEINSKERSGMKEKRVAIDASLVPY